MSDAEAADVVAIPGRRALSVARVTTGPQAAAVAHGLAEQRPGARFALVLSADLGAELEPVLAALAAVRAEVVCADAVEPSRGTGQQLAETVLGLGVGQDFVFTVADPSDAVAYALARVAAGDAAHWEATDVLVVGPPPFLAGVDGSSVPDRTGRRRGVRSDRPGS